MNELHERIRSLREYHDLKQKEIATYLGVAPQTYSNYENGHRQIPVWVVVKLTEYYKISADALLGTGSSHDGRLKPAGQYPVSAQTRDIMYDIQILNEDSHRKALRYIQQLRHQQEKK